MFVTECGLAERARIELPDKEFFGACLLCPYMRKNDLQVIYDVLKSPKANQHIEVSESIRKRARRAVDNMFRLTEKSQAAVK